MIKVNILDSFIKFDPWIIYVCLRFVIEEFYSCNFRENKKPYLFMFFNLQDHGIFREANKEMTESQNELYKRSLSQDINRHAAVVLEGRAVGKGFPLNLFTTTEFIYYLFFSCTHAHTHTLTYIGSVRAWWYLMSSVPFWKHTCFIGLHLFYEFECRCGVGRHEGCSRSTCSVKTEFVLVFS